MAAVVLAGSLTFLGAGAANAEPVTYPGDGAPLTVTDSTVERGEPVTIMGSGYAPNEDIEITVTRGDSGSTGQSVTATVVMQRTDLVVQADANGDFVAQVELGNREGTYLITATGLESGVSHSVQVTVVADDEDEDDWNNDDEDYDNGSDDDAAGGAGNGAGNGNGTGNGTGTTAAGGPASLANTGLDSGALLLGGGGVLLLGAGAAALIVSRRRVA
ncbi:hypothetical protein NCCP1664_16350 [Zafaria cholistanensis]|uniref:Gram-positive cocci surface proteins LPxTG domain-containing protein n=2 Tax=Zafaria cholistanensis TaxID=1682741 RepID=A0A5A7NR00_9MICC|nr:hypothetical protein NCCP1664_16350 [Zafaria cholistanensis]